MFSDEYTLERQAEYFLVRERQPEEVVIELLRTMFGCSTAQAMDAVHSIEWTREPEETCHD